jgi:hypothetical protein
MHFFLRRESVACFSSRAKSEMQLMNSSLLSSIEAAYHPGFESVTVPVVLTSSSHHFIIKNVQ